MTKPNDSNPWRSILFLFCASLVACQSAFGDYKAGQLDGGVVSGVGGRTGLGGAPSTSTAGNTARAGNTSNGGTASGGATSANACNSDGIYRCTDTSIETCVSHQWQALLSCSRDLCDSDRGRCMTCAPGANRCSAFNLQTCASSGDSWTTTNPCDTAEYCDSVSNTCYTCLPGEAFCSGASLYKCNAAQNGWNVTDCSSPDLCDARAQACGDACPNTDWVSCNAESLIGCDGKGHHIQLDKCASSQLCTQTLKDRASNPTAWNGKCTTGCTPGAYQCNPDNPSELRACPPSGLGWEHVETCLTPELCNAANQKCDSGCGVPPGTYRCNGAQLELCNADGTGFDLLKTCEDSSHCNTQKHDCVACVPGEFQCTNATLQTCNADLTWGTVKTCSSVALCDATHGKCIDPGCTRAGAFQCNGAELQQCATDLTSWNRKDTCVTDALCDAANGRCITPECNYPGAYRCQGSTRQACDEATRKWKDVNTCASGQVCDLDDPTGCMGTCPAIPARCNTVGSQTDAQVCSIIDNLPKWTTVATCATAALCSASDAGALCNNPVCSPGQYSCDGKALRRCNAGRTGWDIVKTCAADQTCDAVGGQCDVCAPNSYTCNSILQLLKCTSDGQANNVVDNCSSVANCYTSSDKLTGYCYRCDPGNAQCVGTTQIQTCAADRRGWNTATTCTNGCQDNAGNSDYCATCPVANEVQCVDYGAPGSTRKCAADRSAWGTTTTCSKGYGCVENGTSDYCADACSPSAAECVSPTSRHVCATDGKGWGATISECADTTSLRACDGGQFVGKTACPSASPYCVNGQCVECTGTAVECLASNTLRTCSNGKWVSSTCPGSTPICSGNTCVACTSSSAPTCTGSSTRQYCAANNTWATSECSGTTPYCQSGNCVECTSSSAPTCASNNTVQSCSNGKYVTTTCSGTSPVCYAATSGAVCAACNTNTKPECLTDGVTRRACVNGAFADTLCAGTNASYCLNGVCAGCNANSAARCTSDDTLSTCDTTSGSWVEQTCKAPTPICAGSPGQCVECAPNSAWVCTGSNTRHSCTNNKNVDETCTSGQICDPADATCKTPVCATNELRCSGNILQKCNGSRTNWDTLQTCTGACYSGACVTCAPGSSTCDGTTGIRTCAADGSAYGSTKTECAADGTSLKTCSGGVFTGSTPCPSNAPICNNGQCVPAQCDVGQRRCSEGVPQICNATRTGWDPLAACSGATPVCQASTGTCGCSQTSECAAIAGAVCYGGQCVTATCNSGQFQCTNNKLQKCNATRTGWDDVETCTGATPVCQASGTTGTCGCSTSADCSGTPATPICSGNKCIAPVCSVGQTQCTGNVAQICNETRTGWTEVTTCAGVTPVCQPSTGQCGCSKSEDCAGTSATPICSNGTCVAPACSTGQHQCQGDVQQICNETRTGWVNEATCSGTTPKCLTSTGMCGCSGSSDCAATPATPVCTNGVCVAAPVETCTTGAHHCDGNTQQLCNATHTGWDNETVCAGSTPICQTDTGTCGCVSETECSTLLTTPHCNTTSRTCVACRTSSDCSGTTPICSSGQCAPCSDTLVCPDGTCLPTGSCLVTPAG